MSPPLVRATKVNRLAAQADVDGTTINHGICDEVIAAHPRR